MLRRVITLVLFISFAGPSAAVVGDAGPVNWDIVPATVLVQIGSSGRCTGVVLGSDLVLTAAHCVKRPGKVRILLPGVTSFDVDKAIPHPEFISEATRNVDVALLKLSRPFLKDVRPARMDAEPVKAEQPMIIVGYGKHDGGKLDTKARMTLLTAGWSRPEGMIILLDEKSVGVYGKLGACGGDSGGPVFSVSTGVPLLVGIITGAPKECGGRTFVTTIEHNHTWIVATAIELGARLGR